MCLLFKNFTGSFVRFIEFSVPENSEAKRQIASKILEKKEKLGIEIFKRKIIERITKTYVDDDFWIN